MSEKKVSLKHGKVFTFLVVPCFFGILAAIIALAINPDFGLRFGNKLYTAHKDILSYAYAVARANRSVVNIYVSRLNRDYTGMESIHNGEITNSASGVIMTSDGYIITNYHVIPSLSEPNQAVWAQTIDGELRQAFIVGYDRRTDIAVLKVKAQNLSPIPIDQHYVPRVGDVVLAIGNPNNLGQTVTHGIISATARSGSGLLSRDMMNIREGLQDLIQTDAPINQGNSGGALINTNGDLVGINTASFNQQRYGSYGIGFAVPTKLVVHVLNEILLHGRVIRGYLGISDENDALVANNSIDGVQVRYIDPLGPAAASGLRENDIVIGVDGTTIHNVRELIDIVSNTKPGTELKIKVRRERKELVFPIKVAEDKPNF